VYHISQALIPVVDPRIRVFVPCYRDTLNLAFLWPLFLEHHRLKIWSRDSNGQGEEGKKARQCAEREEPAC
jgi:hypothetical protein